MKKSLKYLFLLLLLLSFAPVNATELVKEGNIFIEQSVNQADRELPYTYKDKKGKEYKLYISKNDAIYIIKTSSKTGKEYKQYLPKEKQEHIKNHLNIKNK